MFFGPKPVKPYGLAATAIIVAYILLNFNTRFTKK